MQVPLHRASDAGLLQAARSELGDGECKAPSRLGRYDLIYPLGAGGMATVYVGRPSDSADFERLLAIKVLHPHLALNPRFVGMFLDEARLAAAIHHPNVAEINAVEQSGDFSFMVGELVEGQDLDHLLHRVGTGNAPLTEGMCAQICALVCTGLHAAHEAVDEDGTAMNLVHRDVSPSNILVGYDGAVKLIDFGVAWARERLSQTLSGSIKGKVGYMSPEQMVGRTLDRRSDLFAVGVVLYKMVTGTHPFAGGSMPERMVNMMSGCLVPPSQVNPRLHAELERIVLKAMSRSADKRFATAEEMAHALRRFARRSGDVVHPSLLSEVMQRHFCEELGAHQQRLSSLQDDRQRAKKRCPRAPMAIQCSARSSGRKGDTVTLTHTRLPTLLVGRRRTLLGSPGLALLAVAALLGSVLFIASGFFAQVGTEYSIEALALSSDTDMQQAAFDTEAAQPTSVGGWQRCWVENSANSSE